MHEVPCLLTITENNQWLTLRNPSNKLTNNTSICSRLLWPINIEKPKNYRPKTILSSESVNKSFTRNLTCSIGRSRH